MSATCKDYQAQISWDGKSLVTDNIMKGWLWRLAKYPEYKIRQSYEIGFEQKYVMSGHCLSEL